MKFANLGLAFLLELVALAAFGYWGFHAGGSLPVKILLGLGAPALIILFGGVLVAPQAVIATSQGMRHLLAMMVFALAAWALYAADRPGWAMIFIIVAVVNRRLLIIWRQ